MASQLIPILYGGGALLVIVVAIAVARSLRRGTDGPPPAGGQRRAAGQGGPAPKFTIPEPWISFLDLSGGKFAQERAMDIEVIGSVFRGYQEPNSEAELRECPVLFIYCRVNPDGTLEGSQRSLRELIRDCRAVVVVVATENPIEAYIKATPKTGYGFANLVMTNERNGAAFPAFFKQLFTMMFAGQTMPVAWNELIPQHKYSQPKMECPGTVMACEAGQVVFSRQSYAQVAAEQAASEDQKAGW